MREIKAGESGSTSDKPEAMLEGSFVADGWRAGGLQRRQM